MSAVVAVLNRAHLADAVLDEVREDTDAAADVLCGLLAQFAEGADFPTALVRCLESLRERRYPPLRPAN